MIRDHLASSAAAVVGVSLLASTSQAPPPQPPAQGQQPAFAAMTVVVEVDAIVTDSKGRFVPDLTADDFEVLEDGKPQRIQRIYIVSGGRTQLARAVSPAAVEPPAPAQPALQLPPAPPRVFILFFDQDHLTEGSFARLKPAGEEFLKAQFQPGDVGGVLVGGTMVGNRLTGSGEELIAAVRSARISADQTSRRRDLQDWPRMSEVEAIRIAVNFDNYVLDQVVRRAEREGASGRIPVDVRPTVMEKARLVVNQLRPAAAHTLTTLQALVNGLARVPGRKTVVFMTEGFFVEESWAQLQQIVGLAARSNVRLYSIDALGLRRRDPGTDLREMTPLETGGSIPLDAFNTVEEGPNMLANDTGGYVIRNTNDFAGALAEIARDTSHYYVIGYSPTNAVMDGSFRSITVKVKPAGLSVRARRGYVATPQLAAPPAAGPTPTPGAGDVPVGTPERATVTGAPTPLGAPAGATPPAAWPQRLNQRHLVLLRCRCVRTPAGASGTWRPECRRSRAARRLPHKVGITTARATSMVRRSC
jgi:VWFA-related protein